MLVRNLGVRRWFFGHSPARWIQNRIITIGKLLHLLSMAAMKERIVLSAVCLANKSVLPVDGLRPVEVRTGPSDTVIDMVGSKLMSIRISRISLSFTLL